ncbi:BREX-2 system adenine-specific DNA-methyltransferase PglX [Kibdelosporangium aridum]|uniref:site-specific DNA-methyltransferase (adenine-specific) n=1 Tax=Kibdelosporangium aridum TaxID=2030 RepID=A0A428Z2D1_KIBAR|nr:BREX-2 system adenine-specific DNA-methyltransferase PglX [Kibdelosporangium aridum]
MDRTALLADLIDQVRVIEQDLNDQLDRGELAEELTELKSAHDRATTAQRTAADFDTWRAGEVTQSAVAWVLGTVFVRWCEDNELIAPMLSGPDHRMADAQDTQSAYFRMHHDHTNRHWLLTCFDALRRSDAGAMLFDPAHNPAYRIPVSHDGAKALIAFWRTRRADGRLAHDFRDEAWDTRFLGDLYQDLSERAKDQYALLQTPEFVEKFILKYTLEPALTEFGHEGLRLIDPTCGSGHFLLSAFDRLVEAWRHADTRLNDTEVARRALDSVHGVDINPFAVAIARFRLMLAAWRVAGINTIEQAAGQRWAVTIATGDSLLANRRETLDGMDAIAGLQLAAEDTQEFSTLLNIGSYHVVVGNPPYITVKDTALNREYRRYYTACHRQYQLTIPFAQRFFELARPAEEDGRGAGYVGQITSNAFMKREFGTKLIEEFFPRVDLTYVIDTSGAFIPGHGTPTVILMGRNRRPDMEGTVRAVLGIRGEPSQPPIPAEGNVWRAIESAVDRPGSESDWISVVDLPRSRLATHPWSLAGGGADQLLLTLERAAVQLLSSAGAELGTGAVTREDAVYMVGLGALKRHRIPDRFIRPLVEGEVTRDWRLTNPVISLWPYQEDTLVADAHESVVRWLWPYRLQLSSRVAFGKTQIEHGRSWFEYSMFFASRFRIPVSLGFAFVATHNHFVLDHDRNVFSRSAPMIKLWEGATAGDHMRLLGVLNSSVACFWLKQVSQPKGGSGIGRGVQDEDWEDRYEFTGTKLEQFPLPKTLPLDRARRLDNLAQQLTTSSPQAVTTQASPSRERLGEANDEYQRIRARMIAEQEELDWDVYQRYGLLSESEAAAVVIPDAATVPALNLGERPFEIILARQVAAGETDTQWFARHGSTPITELPDHWPVEYQRVVQARIDLIKKRRDLALIERPECKRRWSAEDWDAQAERAVREWLQDRLEADHLWFAEDELGARQPEPRSVAELADLVRPDAEWGAVAAMWAADFLGRPDADTAEIVAALVDDEHVPFLAAYRYKGKGFINRKAWEEVWELQRAEDQIAAELGQEFTDPRVREAVKTKLGTIPVPPKYGSADFARPSYWRHRGKLDVPKERFISYPGASRDGDGSLLLGWAGWDHREQAHALAVTITHRRNEAGWGADRLLPLLAGLAEVLPWVRQWHTEIDPAYGTSPAEAYDGFLDTQLADLDLGVADLKIQSGRVDVSPLPNRRRGTPQGRQPAERRETGPDPAQRDAVLEFASGGPVTTAQVAELLGVDTPKARALVRRLVTAGDLVQTGERRGARYHLPNVGTDQ